MSLFNALKTGDTTTLILQVLATTFVVFCTLPIHEYAHAWAATKLGDDTARLSGRLSLNPIVHLSPWGTIMIYLFGFGYAKPVPVNPRNFKNSKQGMALTAVAGPSSNLIMAFILLIIYQIIAFFIGTSETISLIASLFRFAAIININLAVFNLLPIPPLDGSKILALVVPDRYYYKIMQYEQIMALAVMALLYMGILSVPLSFLSNAILSVFDFILDLPFRFIPS